MFDIILNLLLCKLYSVLRSPGEIMCGPMPSHDCLKNCNKYQNRVFIAKKLKPC